MAYTARYFEPQELQSMPVLKFREWPAAQAALKVQNRRSGVRGCSNGELIALLTYVLGRDVTQALLAYPNVVLLETTAAVYLDFVGYTSVKRKDLQYTLLANLVWLFTDRSANQLSKWYASAQAVMDSLGLPEDVTKRLYTDLVVEGGLRKSLMTIYEMPE